MELEPLSYDDFCERYENQVPDNDYLGAFTTYLCGYWVQQNPDKVDDEVYIKMKARYEDRNF